MVSEDLDLRELYRKSQPDVKIAWSPLPGSQTYAISCPCNHILYEGARGPGKTDAQLMRFRKNVGKGYGQFWRGVIFDREYKNLDDIVQKSERWFRQIRGGGEFLRAGKDYKWHFPDGEELLFRAVAKERDYWDYHGQEFPFIGWNELSKYPDPKLYDLMLSCNRSSFLPLEHTPKDERGNYKTKDGKPLPDIPLEVFSTTNPYGPGHNWVKARMVDRGAPGEVVRVTTNVFNPRTQQREDIVRTQVRIFGSYKENRYLSPLYVAFLENIKEPNRRKAWLYGDWDIVAGGAIDDLWDPAVHVLPRFPIPAAWRVTRAFDWGSSKPFSVGWYCICDGGEIRLPNGQRFGPPKGSLIRIAEWYGTAELGTNDGLKMGSADVAAGILKREADMLRAGWIAKMPTPGPADNAIWAQADKKVKSIGTIMAENGVEWTESDKRPGSRKTGLQLVRDALEVSRKLARGEDLEEWIEYLKAMRPKASNQSRAIALYFFDNCKAALSTLPVLPRDDKDPDDVDTDAEDHVYDELRYEVQDAAINSPIDLSVKHPT